MLFFLKRRGGDLSWIYLSFLSYNISLYLLSIDTGISYATFVASANRLYRKQPKNSLGNTKVCDLSDEKGRIELHNWIAENHNNLNILVNNAGIQNWMKIGDDDFYEKANDEIATNVLAPIHLTKLFT